MKTHAYQCDKHVVKMVTESVQMLSVAMFDLIGSAPYKKSHINHPCTLWTKRSLANYQWLWHHCNELGNEYTNRYNKIHKSHLVLLNDIPFVLPFEEEELTEFVNCTPYKHMSVINVYREYYRNEKRYFAKWKNNNTPFWF